MLNKKRTISKGDILLYGAGGLSLGVARYAFSGVILFYGITALGIYGAVVAAFVVLSQLLAALIEPKIAHASELSKSRLLGRRHGFVAGVFLLAIVNAVLFLLPQFFPQYAAYLWLAALLVLLEIVKSLVSVPYIALSEELGGSAAEREALSAARNIFDLVGVLALSVMTGILLKDGKTLSEYRNIAYIGSILILATGIIACIGTYKHLPRLNKKSGSYAQQNRFKGFGAALKQTDKAIPLLGYMFSVSAIALCLCLGQFFMRRTLGYEFWMISLVCGALVFTLLVSRLLYTSGGARKGLVVFGCVFMLFGAGLFATTFSLHYSGFFVRPEDTLPLLVMGAVLIGAGGGGALTLARNLKQFRGEDAVIDLAARIAISTALLFAGGFMDIAGFLNSPEHIGTAICAALAVLIFGSTVLCGLTKQK